MKYGYARNPREEKLLVQGGIRARDIYLEGRGAECLEKIRFRPGDMLITVNGLRSLGDSRRDIVAVSGLIHAQGAVIQRIGSDLRSDSDGIAMLDDALALLRSERSMSKPRQALEMQAKSVEVRTKGRMPHRQAEAIWRDPMLSVGEAIDRMRGWSFSTAYRVFGKRDTPAGRKSGNYARHVTIERLRRGPKGTIYFCRASGKGPVKIGYSRDVVVRLRELQVSHHTELHLFALIEGTHADEQALHRRFKAQHIKGEWFKVEGALKKYLDSIQQLPPEK